MYIISTKSHHKQHRNKPVYYDKLSFISM